MCVLLVEDEPLIRLVLAEAFAEAGYAVIEAEDGAEAAALIEHAAAEFTLLVTDLHMPGGCDGAEVARLMREHYPLVPVIYMTGRPDLIAMTHPAEARDALLPKPFAPSELLRAAERLLRA